MPSHHLTNLEIKKYYESKSKIKGVYSQNVLPNIMKYGAYVVNLDEYESIGIHWIVLYINSNSITYFDFFFVEHRPHKIHWQPDHHGKYI